MWRCSLSTPGGFSGFDGDVIHSPAGVGSFPSTRELLDRYAAATGRDLEHFSWYLGFAWFKLAVILEGIQYRSFLGKSAGDEFRADEDGAAEGSSVDEVAGSSEAESASEVATDQTARPRRGRRKAAEAGKSAFNGVDTGAVRAWAAANGIAVSPRGRIKDEVIEAYRAAGN